MTVAKFLAASLLAAPIAAAAAQTASPADSGRKADRAAWIAGAATGGALFLLFTRTTRTVAAAASPTPLSGITPHPARPITGPATVPVASPAGGTTSGSPQDPTPNGSRADSTYNPPNNRSQPQPHLPPSDDGSSGLALPNFTSAPGTGAGTGPNGTTDGRGTAEVPPSTPQRPPATTDEPPPPLAPHFALSGPEQPFTAPDDPPPDGGGPVYTTSAQGERANAFLAPDHGTSTVPEPGSLALTATGIVALVPLLRRRR